MIEHASPGSEQFSQAGTLGSYDRNVNQIKEPLAPLKIPVIRSALDVQVGGNHYAKRKIQPVEYIHANDLGFLEGCIVKRITRWRDKNGFEDLQKIKHEVDLLIELESRNSQSAK